MTGPSIDNYDDDRARQRRLALLIAGVFLALRLPVMLHGYDINDEALWSTVTARWLDGGRLYVDAFERRPPLLFVAYAGVFEIAGRYNMFALHVVGALWTLATMAGLGVAARRMFDARAGLAAAALYGIYAGWGDYNNLAWNGEVLLNLPLAWAIAIAFGPSRARLRPELALAGALVAAAFLFKQPAASAAVALGGYLLLPSYRRARGLGLVDALAQAALFSAGFATVVGVAAWRVRASGAWDDAMFWVFHHHDMPHGPADVIFWERLEVAGVWFILACLPLIVSAFAALSPRGRWVDWARGSKEAERVALWLLLAMAMLGVSASGRFYLHYFDLLLPALVIAASPVVAALVAGAPPAGWPLPWPLRPRAMRGLLAGTALAFFALHAIGLATRTKGSDAGRFVREQAAPGDELFVWGELPRVYVESGLHPATRYVGTYPLTGFPYGGSISYDPPVGDTTSRIVPGTWDIFERELSASAPRFFVDVEAKLKQPIYPLEKFPWLARYVAAHYRKVHEARDGVVYERVATGS
ncbi:MAG TPA: glycosyltransferase family 39 protein [Polyangia bacterium]|nr:glycosyltransferase family 39 protein [Polyangia bacterium]